QRRDPARRLRTRQLVEYRDVRGGQADHRLAHGPHLAGIAVAHVYSRGRTQADRNSVRDIPACVGRCPMGRRLITAAVGASLVAASCAGCFTDDKVTQKTARITVDKNTRTSHAVTCNQVDWLLTANISAAPANVRVLLKLDPETPKVESVNFDNFAGFSGVSDSGAGEAKVRFANN